MEPQFVTLPAFTVVGLTIRSNGQGEPFSALWNRFIPRMHEIQGLKPNATYGVMDHYDEASGEFDYTAGSEATNTPSVPEGMRRIEVPGQTYAVFTCTLPTIGEAYRQIETWLPQSGYQRAHAPEFERYDERFDPAIPDSPMDIYIPVVKA